MNVPADLAWVLAETGPVLLDFDGPICNVYAGHPARTVAERLHCTAGKDRTGVLVALLLRVAGVSAEDVAADYARSDGCAPAVMLNTLVHLKRRYGGVERYLLGGGVGAEHLDAVRRRLST